MFRAAVADRTTLSFSFKVLYLPPQNSISMSEMSINVLMLPDIIEFTHNDSANISLKFLYFLELI